MNAAPDALSPGSDELPRTSLAVQVHAMRAAASLIEHAGIPGLYLTVDADPGEEITIQVPEYLDTPAERTAAVARLAAAVGGTATRKESTTHTFAWVRAAGTIDGHTVSIYTSITNDEPPSPAPDAEHQAKGQGVTPAAPGTEGKSGMPPAGPRDQGCT